ASGVTDAVSQPAPSSFPEFCRVVVVGAGASGLSAAACLKRRGEHDVLLLERSSSVGGSWAAQYEGLKITTRHKHCGLPGWPVPKEGFCERGDGELSAPDFLRRVAHFISDVESSQNFHRGCCSWSRFVGICSHRYLTGYCRRFDLDVATDTEVLSAEQEHADGEGAFNRVHGGIRLQIRRASVPGGAATISVVRCTHIVVATGKNASPAVPSDILRTLGTFSGEVVHSSKVSGISALARRKVCIVGMGNSACDLALALLEYGAGKVYISTRSAPPIIMRQWGPLSLEWVSRCASVSIQYLPSKFVDSVLVAFGMARWGKNWRHRAFPKGLRQTWQARSSGRVPCIDKARHGCGELVPALLDRRIEVHGCIECAHGSFLHFRNSG
ncbi:unnamed protein product, partial [Sphacelaria rigidula]